MAANKVSEGKVFDYIASTDEASGGIKVFSAMCGVNLNSAVTGEPVSCAVEGAWTLPKATGSGFSQGDRVGAFGTPPLAVPFAAVSGAIPLGHCEAEALAGAGLETVNVKLNAW